MDQAREMPGLFIVVEGIDGSGKTTVAEALAHAIAAKGREVRVTREPGGTEIGERVRGLLLEETKTVMAPETEALLFAAARAQHVTEVIQPALRRGSVVICDRFVDSSLAYQWGGRGLPKDLIVAVQQLATGGLRPDLKILLDLPVEVALRRRFADSENANRLDGEQIEFYTRVRQAYLTLAAAASSGWYVVNAEKDRTETTLEVLRIVDSVTHLPLAHGTVAAVGDSKDLL